MRKKLANGKLCQIIIGPQFPRFRMPQMICELRSFELTGNDIVYLAFHLTRFTWARMMKVIALSPLRITKKNGTFQEAWWRQPNRISEKCWTGSLPFGRPVVPQR